MGVSVSPHFITKSRRPSKADLANLRNVIKIPRFLRSLSSIFFSLSFFYSYISMDGGKEGRCLPKTCNRRCAIKKKRKKSIGGRKRSADEGQIFEQRFFFSFIRDARFIEAVNVDKNLHRQRKETSLSKVLRFFLLFSFPRFFHARELQFKGRIMGSSKRKIRILVEKKRILEFLGDSLVARKK